MPVTTTCRLPLGSVLLGAFLACAAPAQSAEAPPPDDVVELEAFVVTGEQPGPALWKVTRKGHTLWLLASFGPLPDRLVWKSSDIEEVIRNSQEVYAHTLIPLERPTDLESQQRLLKAISNPDGNRLPAVMRPDLYEQFSDLNRRYAGNNRMLDTFRPYQAADMLKEGAMAQLGLASDGGIGQTVYDLARRHNVGFRTFKLKETHAWDIIITQLEKTPREADIPCTKARLDRLDADLRQAVDRSNAWARGDIEALRQDEGLRTDGVILPECKLFLEHMKFVRKTMLGLRRYSYSTYNKALKKNRSTLAVVPIREMFDPDGLIARFRKAGYQVEEP